jgi:hypothetical protein
MKVRVFPLAKQKVAGESVSVVIVQRISTSFSATLSSGGGGAALSKDINRQAIFLKSWA